MGIYDGLKDAASILKEAGKIDQYRQILEAQEKLLDMQKQIADLESDNQDLKDKLKTKESLTYENNAYWIEGEKKDGPFCSRCWDSERQIIRMQPCGNRAYASCPNCSNKSVKIDPHFESPFTPIDPRRNSTR